MRLSKKLIVCSAILFSSSSVVASSIDTAVNDAVDSTINNKKTSFTYTGLYKSLETSKESEFSQLSLHFLLLDGKTNKRCPTQKIMLSDGEVKHQVMVNDAGALLLPLDKKLKKDHAAISFYTNEAVNCYLSMQISVADFELDKFSKSNLLSWLNQFENIYSTLAGWPGRYFMPSVNGIVIHVDDKKADVLIDKDITNQLSINNGRLLLTRETLEALPDNSELTFGHVVNKVLPTLEK